MIKKWRTLKNVEAYRGRIFRYRQLVRESTTQEMRGDFDVLDFLDWVNMIALTADNQILLVRQYRQGLDEVTLEIPGGAVHIGEDPLLAAKRELREETGYEAKEWRALGSLQPNPAIQSNTCSVYLATGCEKIGEPELDPLEELEVITMPVGEFKALIKSGEVRHSLVVAAMYLAADLI